MRPNQKNRYGGRYNNSRGARPQTIFRNTALESSGPLGKLHGTALQLFEKYQAAAKDALVSNDLILSETCLQFADHYMRLQNMAIANEQNFRSNQNNVTQNQSRPAAQSSDDTPAPQRSTEPEDTLPNISLTSFKNQDIPAFLEAEATPQPEQPKKQPHPRRKPFQKPAPTETPTA